MKTALTWTLFALACTALVACGSGPKRDGRADYGKASVERPLDMPPQLSPPRAGAEAMELPNLQRTKEAVLPLVSNVRMARAGDMRWLVVQADPAAVFESVREFWRKEGLELVRDVPKLGLVETQWAENRADVPKGLFRSLVSKVAPSLYNAGTRDKFRTRLERGAQAGTTEIFVTHYGLAEVEHGETTAWRVRPSDPELEGEMTARLMQHLGAPEETVRLDAPAEPSRVAVEGDHIVLTDAFPRAWRRVGIALDRIGFIVEDYDRSTGTYYVKANAAMDEVKKEGWFAGLFAGGQQHKELSLLVKIKSDDQRSQVRIDAGEAVTLPASVQLKLLQQLAEQLH